jgi:glycosyltransferase involved in cell wall biosynthesis
MTAQARSPGDDDRTTVVLLNHTDKVRPEVEKLSRTLPREEFEVVVVLPERSRETLDPREDVTYRFYGAKFVPYIRYTLPDASFYRLSKETFRRADVVHVIGYAYLPCVAATAIASRFDVDSIVTVDAFPGISWTYGNRFVDLVAGTYTHTLGRATFALADRVIGLGEYLREDLRRFTDDPSKIGVIPNGVDTDRYTPARRESPPSSGPDEPTELLYVGRLDTVKGVPHLLRAMAKLRREPKEYRLTIVGDGSHREDYESLCESLGIAGQVGFEGWQSNVRPYYERADAFVLPSLSEGLPTVLMEAQATGLPVVSTDVGGVRELVGAGRIVPCEDPDALSAAVADLADEDLAALGRTARQHVVENFSVEAMAREYASLYREAAPESVAVRGD